MLQSRIVEIANEDSSEPTYQQILQANAGLSDACWVLKGVLSGYGTGLLRFRCRGGGAVVRPYFLALHIPYMRLALSDPVYHFSRELRVDTALRLSCATLAPPPTDDPTPATLRAIAGMESQWEQYVRLMICGPGPSRSSDIQNNYPHPVDRRCGLCHKVSCRRSD